MKKFLPFILYVVLLFLITGCAQEALLYKYDNEKDIRAFEIVEKEDVPEGLLKPGIESSSLVIMLEALQEQGIVQALRYNKEHYYSITPLSDGSYLLLLFEMSRFEANGEEEEILYVVDNCLIPAAAVFLLTF